MFFRVHVHDLKRGGKTKAKNEYSDLYEAMVDARKYVAGLPTYNYAVAYIFDSHGQLVKAYHNAGEKLTEC